ncbi:endonuclease [Cereibacter johrii]|uniref:endonuclease n=1 Tax=Cereibacter johrii TaxID=445629 RepID=UPI002B26223B|nr:endonuclease [Cereibacter johrii]MEA5162601.1 endonuclease [Cereibacter johrii]
MADPDRENVPAEAHEPVTSAEPKTLNAYQAIIVDIFQRFYRPGMEEFEFGREEIHEAAARTGVKAPKNLGDVIYTFRYRRSLPKAILDCQPAGRFWLILGAGDARYRFRLSKLCYIEPTPGLLVRKIPDATPEIIAQYALSDEQALLAKVRYNRLIDIFLGITAYSLQNHLRTKIPNYGQIEIDELYVGLDSKGAQFIVPVQAKGGSDRLGVIQTIQDTIFCRTAERYRHCVARTVSAQFMGDDVIAMFELYFDEHDVSILQEKHYRLVPAREITGSDLGIYRLS